MFKPYLQFTAIKDVFLFNLVLKILNQGTKGLGQ